MSNRRAAFPNNPLGNLGGIVMMIFFFIALYFVATGLFRILAFVAPVLLLITLFIDHKVVTNYIKWVVNLFKTNILWGLGMSALTFFGFPVVVGFLFSKALVKKKVKEISDKYEERTQGEFVEYEEVDEEPPVRIEIPEKLDINRPPKQKPIIEVREKKSDTGDYEQLFD